MDGLLQEADVDGGAPLIFPKFLAMVARRPKDTDTGPQSVRCQALMALAIRAGVVVVVFTVRSTDVRVCSRHAACMHLIKKRVPVYPLFGQTD